MFSGIHQIKSFLYVRKSNAALFFERSFSLDNVIFYKKMKQIIFFDVERDGNFAIDGIAVA
jgi:hypothetical protein